MKSVFFRQLRTTAAAVGLLALTAGIVHAESIVVASTTSTEQSGLFGELLPEFQKSSGIEVRVVAQGTGQALETGRRGDADVLFVHNQVAEEEFVAEGYGVERFPVMYNDFVLIGPKDDPAGVAGDDITAALQKVASENASFVSRGDNSGTHAAELRFWKAAEVKDMGEGYKECGCGMGPALNIAASDGAYVMSDRATWLNFKNRADLAILVEGDERLFNQYGVILVNPEKHDHVKKAEGQAFIDWLVSDEGQEAIAAYKIDGEQLFFPNAND
ncbi:MAG TPA: extracellular solute-binding protein [Azoarcus sp.]|nr:extracellular solute-binding protein [Azoarcus sp.]